MAPHLPLPISSGRCGDNGGATSDPVGISPIGRWQVERLDGQGPHRAACSRKPRAPPRSARHSGIFESPATRGAADTIVTTTTTNVVVRRGRYNELTTMLENRRRQLLHEVQATIRDARTDSTLERDVLDQGESSEVDARVWSAPEERATRGRAYREIVPDVHVKRYLSTLDEEVLGWAA